MNAWTATDLWIVLAGALAGLACVIPGTFLLLRRMSMMGDAISHAVLPGIAIAFIVSQSRGGPALLLGAVLAGILSAVLTQILHSRGEVEESASMGVVFTLMFAAGLILLNSPMVGKHVDLDLDCVLFGAVELVALEAPTAWLPGVPAPIARLSVVLLINLLCLGLLYKEWKLSSFDPALADALGFSTQKLHLLLMVLTAVTAVYCFEIVGSILVIAMLIVPVACARMFTDRLLPTLLFSGAFAIAAAVLGHASALTVPQAIGFEDTSSAGAMAAVGGVLFFLSVFLAPRHGLLRKSLHRRSLALRTLEEDLLGRLYREAELDTPHPAAALTQIPDRLHRIARQSLRRRGFLDENHVLTHKGFHAGAELLRRHRLWEEWLHENTATALDHLHTPAEALEHVTDPRLRERLAEDLGQPRTDPTGRRIPQPETEGSETVSLPPPS
jgi:manganese/zinc/iron transport system permease protein